MARHFGVEIECQNVTKERVLSKLHEVGIAVRFEGYTHRVTEHWKVVTDGSIGAGFELVSPILSGRAGIAEVKKVAKALTDINAKVDRRCGLHVHLNVSDLTVDEAKNFVARYAKYEREIDAFMPPSRRGSTNMYCRSITGRHANDVVNASAATVRELGYSVHGRYYKVNLQSLQRHGTIEVRHHSGSVDPEKIANWITFLLSFMERSKVLASSGGRVTRPTSGRFPRQGTKRMQIADFVRDGKSACEIAAIMNLVPTNVVYHVFCLERDYSVKFRKVSLGEGDYRWDVVRWFGEESGTEAPRSSVDVDGGLFDGIPENVTNFYRERAGWMARHAA